MPDLLVSMLLAVAALSTTTAIPPSKPTNGTYLISGGSNLTSSDLTVDRDFGGHVAAEGSQVLETDAGLLSLTKMMYQLSYLPFNGFTGSETWTDPTTLTVSIEFKVLPGWWGQDVIPTRFAIWAAQDVGRHILYHREVRDLVWAFTWSGEVVGFIEVKSLSQQQLLFGPGGSARSRQPSQVPNLDLQQVSDDRNVRVVYNIVRDRPLTKWELFANIYSLLAFTSEHPLRQKVPPEWTITPTIFPITRVQFGVVRGKEAEYRDIAWAAMSAAFFIISQNLVFTLVIRVQLDGEEICRGVIYKGEY